MRPPEDVLYAFSQWLQQWAGYALSQAQLFAAATGPGDPAGGIHAAGGPPASLENQPPAHWLELAQPGPPPHWLALFEAYGLEPPATDAPPGDAPAGGQTPESAPRPLQDWLGEFQRGLAQFAQQPDPSMPDSLLAEQEAASTNRAQLVPGKDLAAGNPPPADRQDNAIAETPKTLMESQGDGDKGDPTALTASNAQTLTPGPSITSRDADGPTHVRFSKVQDLAAGSALPDTPEQAASLERQQARPGSQETQDQGESTAPNSPHIFHPKPPTVSPSLQIQSRGSQVIGLIAGAKSDTAGVAIPSPQMGTAETRPAPVRLRLNPRPPVAAPVPAPSPLPDAGGSDQPAHIKPSQAAPRPRARLHIGLPTPRVQPPSAQPAPSVDPVSQSQESKPAPPPSSFATPQDSLPQANPAEADLLRENVPDLPSPPIRWMKTTIAQEPKDQDSPEWSQSTTGHWPELPERLPPVHLPSNVLAEPAHRTRIDREQRGRSWNA